MLLHSLKWNERLRYRYQNCYTPGLYSDYNSKKRGKLRQNMKVSLFSINQNQPRLDYKMGGFKIFCYSHLKNLIAGVE